MAELRGYYKTGTDEVTAFYSDKDKKQRKISKAQKRLEKMIEENEKNKDKEDWTPLPVNSLEFDLWLIEKFAVEEIPEEPPVEKHYRRIGLFGVAYQEMAD